MLGNLAISVICATVYGVTAVILDLPYPLALALIAGSSTSSPTVGATIAGVIIGVVALSVSLGALVAFAIVMVVYQQVENYVLQPTIIGRAAAGLGLHRARQRPGVRRAVRVHRRDHRRADRSGRCRFWSRSSPRPGGLASRPPTSLSSSRPDRPQSRKACDDGSHMWAGPSVATTNHTLEVIVNEHAATPQFAPPSIPSVRDAARNVTGYWWGPAGSRNRVGRRRSDHSSV